VEERRAGTGQTPEEILSGAWHRVAGIEQRLSERDLGPEWQFATGAQWALGCAGLLTDEQIRRWEAHGQAEAMRLLAVPFVELFGRYGALCAAGETAGGGSKCPNGASGAATAPERVASVAASR
jgi:hypothetical protein